MMKEADLRERNENLKKEMHIQTQWTDKTEYQTPLKTNDKADLEKVARMQQRRQRYGNYVRAEELYQNAQGYVCG